MSIVDHFVVVKCILVDISNMVNFKEQILLWRIETLIDIVRHILAILNLGTLRIRVLVIQIIERVVI